MLGNTFVVLFICCFAVIQGSDMESVPVYEYYPEINGWLKLHEEPAEWQAARINCHLEGALLAADWNAEMRSAINKIQAASGQSYEAVYAGAEVTLTLSDDGEFIYLEGEPTLTVLPSGLKRSEQCAIFNVNDTMSYNDCTEPLHYVCFAPASACGKDNLGYQYLNQTQHCYKVYAQKTSWINAYKACASDGAYLAVVNSDEESQLLKQLFNKYSKDYVAAIGIYYWKLSNSWWTINGQTIEEAGFSEWSGQGTDLTTYPEAICGFLDANGKLAISYLNYTAPFICEKNPGHFTGNIIF